VLEEGGRLNVTRGSRVSGFIILQCSCGDVIVHICSSRLDWSIYANPYDLKSLQVAGVDIC